MECSRLHYSLFPHYLDTKIRQEHAAVATGKDPAPACLFNQTLLAFATESRPNAHGSTCPGSEGRGHRRGRWRPAALHWPPHPRPVRDPTPPQVLPRSSPDRPQVRKNPHWNVAPRACVGLKPARVSHLSHFLSRVSILCNEACADSKLAGGDVVLPHYAKPFPTSE